MNVHAMSVIEERDADATNYIVSCVCGWESLSLTDQQKAMELARWGFCDVERKQVEGKVRREARERRQKAA